MIINKIKDFFNNIDFEDTSFLVTLKSKTVLLFASIIGLFILTRFFQNIFSICLSATMLYSAFEFIKSNRDIVISSNKNTLLYFYIFLPFAFMFNISNKLGYNFLFWFLSYIICLKFVDTYIKSFFEKEQSKILLLLLTSIFSIFYGFIFSFIVGIGSIKFICVNLLVLVLSYYDSSLFKNFKEELNINNLTTPVLFNLDNFILSGLLISILKMFYIL